MSLKALEQDIENIRAEASSKARIYAARIREIDADATLSDDGKRAAKSENYNNFKPVLAILRSKEEQLLNSAIESRAKAIESPASSYSTAEIVAFRDAQDRAERVEDADEALRILTRALRQNDTSLAHAILRVALDKRYNNVINAFTTRNPEMRETIDELRELESFRDASMERSMHYGLFR